MGLKKNKRGFSKGYLRTIIDSISHTFLFGFPYALWTAIYKLSGIKAGEYPDMAKELIEQKYYEALPIVIADSIIKCLLIMFILLIPSLIYRFKISHNINLIHELKKRIRKRGEG